MSSIILSIATPYTSDRSILKNSNNLRLLFFRSLAVVPPQTPSSSPVQRAKAKHSVLILHPPQIDKARSKILFCPRSGNHQAGSCPTQAASFQFITPELANQFRRSSLSHWL